MAVILTGDALAGSPSHGNGFAEKLQISQILDGSGRLFAGAEQDVSAASGRNLIDVDRFDAQVLEESVQVGLGRPRRHFAQPNGQSAEHDVTFFERGQSVFLPPLLPFLPLFVLLLFLLFLPPPLLRPGVPLRPLQRLRQIVFRFARKSSTSSSSSRVSRIQTAGSGSASSSVPRRSRSAALVFAIVRPRPGSRIAISLASLRCLGSRSGSISLVFLVLLSPSAAVVFLVHASRRISAALSLLQHHDVVVFIVVVFDGDIAVLIVMALMVMVVATRRWISPLELPVRRRSV